MKLTLTVFLIGFSGSGKTTLGSKLARQWKVSFIDTDQLIEEMTGKSVSRIFTEQGEQYFRALESELLVMFCKVEQPPAITALGGGSLINPINRKIVKDTGLTVYLSCSKRELYRRLTSVTDRPLLALKPKRGETPAQARFRNLSTMLAKRMSGYKMADIRLSTSCKSVDNCIKELKAKLLQRL